jgi:signal transduction histidine kinase
MFLVVFCHIHSFVVYASNAKSDSLSVGTMYDSNPLGLTQIEIDWLSKHPVITVGTDPNWAPFEYRDEKGKNKGIVIDYLTIIEKLLGVKFKFSEAETWNEMYENLKKQKLDVIANITQTPERAKKIIFTKPYFSTPTSIFANQDVRFIGNLSELANKKVSVVEGYVLYEYIRNDYPEIVLVPVKNIKEGLEKVRRDEVFAFIDGMLPVSFYAYDKAYSSIRIVGETPYGFNLSMGVRNDWPELVGILQKALDSITESEKSTIYNNWITLRTQKFDYLLLGKIVIPFFVVLLIVLYWNRTLKVEIEKRKLAQLELDKAFKELKDTHIQLVQTEKMATIGFLTAGIAHEIKNPINYISQGLKGVREGTTSIIHIAEKYDEMLSKFSEQEKQEIQRLMEELEYEYYKKECLNLIRDVQFGADRILEITKSLAVFSRSAADEREETDINSCLESTLVLLRNQYKYTVEIVKEYGTIPLVKCVTGKINQVFVNIVANAIQAIPQKGKITIKTCAENGEVKISIKDTGTGIKEENLKTIFEPFFTTKPVGEGTGLGLAISKKIIDEHKGTIQVFSKLGEGTEFVIGLPMH